MKNFFRKYLYRLLSQESLVEWSLLRKNYSIWKRKNEIIKPCVVFSLDSRFESNGLADRMRGMISTFAYCKANNLEFKIDHQVPFTLSNYLSPANYDWTIKDDEISHNMFCSRPIYFMDKSNPSRIFKIKRKGRLQYHVYTNIDCLELINQVFNKHYSFSELFNELFKPSHSLDIELQRNLNAIGGDYYSISFRFMQLLGDFKDIRGEVLNDLEKEELVRRSLECVKSIQENNPDYCCLVTADSASFLKRASSLSNVYVAPGKIGHIGHNSESDVFLKTFLDFYLVANAQKVYLAYSGSMYSESLFARTASRVNNRTFIKIPY